MFRLVLCWLYSFFRNTVVYNVLLMYWKIIDQDRVLLMRTYPIYKGYSDNRVVIGDRIPKCRFSGPLLLLLYWRMVSLSALSTTVSVPCPMSNTVLLVIHLRMVYACQPHRARSTTTTDSTCNTIASHHNKNLFPSFSCRALSTG